MVIVGIDEVGRGCLAGPVVAGAVVLDGPIAGLKDSKKLTKPQRENLDLTIREQALAIGLGWVDAPTIDNIGISTAVKRAMELALAEVKIAYDEVIVDGNINYLLNNPKSRAIIKADDTVPAVSAASIVAKVARDRYMAEVAPEYADYGFAQHVGYGTALHLERLKLHGVSRLHRRSYKPIQSLLELPT